jgi:KaiC/GvpD/RAD55 family RecA-like ATPase
VKFYGHESSLFATVAGFLSEGLVAGQPAIIVATESHRKGIVEQLAARLIDVVQAQQRGVLMLFDARQTLERFMVDDEPDPDEFERVAGGLIERVLVDRPGAVVRAYGEMVNLLWEDGRAEAAIRLELLWNKLSNKYQFTLLCGYPVGSFYK